MILNFRIPAFGRKGTRACATGAFALLFAPGLLFAEATPETASEKTESRAPLLWKIEGAGNKPSYLFGTIHLTRPSITKLAPPVEKAFLQADAVFTEVPVDMATMLNASQQMLLPDGKTLRDLLSEEQLGKLSAELAAMNPVFTVDIFLRFKPWAVAATLSVLEDQMKYPGALALDMLLFQRAAMAGKETGGIETLDEQLGIFEAFTLAEQIQMLDESIDYMRAAREEGVTAIDRLVEVYLAGDLAGIDAELEKWNSASNSELNERFMERLLYKRNVHMAERIERMMREHPDTGYFFAIGAGHLGGERGVIALLEKAGLKLTRVEE